MLFSSIHSKIFSGYPSAKAVGQHNWKDEARFVEPAARCFDESATKLEAVGVLSHACLCKEVPLFDVLLA